MVFGEDDFDHADDIGMSAIFEENDLAQDSSGFGSWLKEFDDFFDGDVWVGGFAYGFGDVSVWSFADDFFDFVTIAKVLLGEDFVDVVGDFFDFDKFSALFFVFHGE